jgi:hypothetical protein
MITHTQAYFNFKGPWCDVWSIGCSLIHLILGRSSAEEKRKVSTKSYS